MAWTVALSMSAAKRKGRNRRAEQGEDAADLHAEQDRNPADLHTMSLHWIIGNREENSSEVTGTAAVSAIRT